MYRFYIDSLRKNTCPVCLLECVNSENLRRHYKKNHFDFDHQMVSGTLWHRAFTHSPMPIRPCVDVKKDSYTWLQGLYLDMNRNPFD